MYISQIKRKMNIYPGFPRLCFFKEPLAKNNFLETWEFNSITIASEMVLYDSPMLTVPGLGMETQFLAWRCTKVWINILINKFDRFGLNYILFLLLTDSG